MEIPTIKASKVVFTLTDYNKNRERDNYLISVLKSEYKEVYFWPQGYGDFSYLSTLNRIDNIKIVPPHLSDYDHVLSEGDIDFVGTRLHGGIRALQKKVRTLIIGIDNRATELRSDFNLPVLDQYKIRDLSGMLNQQLRTDIHIPVENIGIFLAQFDIIKK